MVHKLWIYLLRLLRYDFFKILNFDLRFGQEVKVKLGSLFYKLTINDLYNRGKIVNLPRGSWDMIFKHIKPLFDVIRHLMTSSWHHNFIMTLGIFTLMST